MGISQAEIAERLGLARSTVTKILNQFPNNRASRETIKRVFKAAREMGYDFGRLRNIHRRRADRKSVHLPVVLRIEFNNGNGVFDTGTALVRDLSPFGALLVSINTEKKTLPLVPFTIHMDFTEPLQGVTLRAHVIRFTQGETIQLGIGFEDVSGEVERRIIEFLE